MISDPYGSLYYIGAAFFVVGVIGAAVLWSPPEKIKVGIFALLLVTTICLTFCQLGLPRPSWVFGVPQGRLVSYQLDQQHNSIHLWIKPKLGKGPDGKAGEGPPISVDVPFSVAGAEALEKAEKAAGQGGQVMIGPNKAQSGTNHSNGMSPFGHIPFVARPHTWSQTPYKQLP